MKLLVHWLNKLPKNTRQIILTCLFGASAGLTGVLFHRAIHWLFELGFVRTAVTSGTDFIWISLLIILSTSLASGYLLYQFCPQAAGSGIPQLKLSYWKDFGDIPFRVAWVKFVAGLLAVGGGTSLGREGPSVQIGGAIASKIASLAGVAKQNRRTAAAAGAAAGLAAAFNAPLAAMTFVLEEVIEDLNSRNLGSVIFSSMIGALIVYALIGKHPAFSVPFIDDHNWIVYLLIPVVSASSALIGVIFQRLTISIRATSKKQTWLPDWIKPSIGALITWILAISVFLYSGHLGVFGLGYHDLSAALADKLPWTVAGLLLVAKLLATAFSYGTGGCGGIFAPTLFLGSMCSLFLVGLIDFLYPLSRDDQILLTVVGMSACMGAVVRAPVTAILIVFEMTHQFSLVPALMLGTLVSQFIARRMCKESLYQELLHQDGHKIEHIIPPRDLQSWQNYPVAAIAKFTPVMAESLEADELRQLLEDHSFQRFPYMKDGKLAGIVSREEIEHALDTGRQPRLREAHTCERQQSISEAQFGLIESEDGIIVILDKAGGSPVGVLTLHDLVRAERRVANNQD
jgi:CIC family chloride channel protein